MHHRDRILITGASGFVGRRACQLLAQAGLDVVAAVRSAEQANPPAAQRSVVGEIGPATDWSRALTGVQSVVHLAAHVHVEDRDSGRWLAACRRVNTEGTLQLAKSAARAGVRRFVFVSTAKVHGQASGAAPFREDQPPRPADPYGQSKLEAEQGLRQVSCQSGLEVAVLRPPLVYGPNVRANFFRMMQWIERGLPLPLGSIDNRRSVIYLDNLVGAIQACLTQPRAAGQVFLVSDGPDLSTPQLLRGLACAMKKRLRLVPCPPPILRTCLKLAGRTSEADRLLASLAIDSRKIRKELAWTPTVSLDEGLHETARWFSGRAA